MKLDIRTALIAGGFAATLGTGIFVGQALAAQPHMGAALESLRAARSELDMATHNKGGHRVKAIGLIDEAIDQVKMGMDDAD
jgi:hypothetical protein